MALSGPSCGAGFVKNAMLPGFCLVFTTLDSTAEDRIACLRPAELLRLFLLLRFVVCV